MKFGWVMAENMWYYIIDSMKAIILSMMSFFHHNMYDASFFYLKVFDSTWVLRKIMDFFCMTEQNLRTNL